MSTRLKSILRTLSAEQHSEVPFLSIYLDWSVNGNGRRQALQTLAQELDRVAADLPAHSEGRASFDADRAAIERYVNDEAPTDARGLIIFARSADAIWVTIPLLVPVETAISADGYPHLYQLARLLDDHEGFVVALVEGQEAHVYVISLDMMEEVEQTAASEEISRVQVGGWSQLRYERHTGYVIKLHLNELAKTLQQTVTEHGVRHIIIGTNDSIKGQLRQSLSPQLQEMVVDMVSYQYADDPERLYQKLEPLMREAERRQEQALLERLHNQLATKNGLAVQGGTAVAEALLKGQVDTLLIGSALKGEGSECPSCGMLRVGQRAHCPADGSEMQPIDLREGMVVHTLRQSGTVEMITIEDGLAEHGGVAALLRFRDSGNNR